MGALQTIADAEEGPNKVEESFVDKLLERAPGMAKRSTSSWSG